MESPSRDGGGLLADEDGDASVGRRGEGGDEVGQVEAEAALHSNAPRGGKLAGGRAIGRLLEPGGGKGLGDGDEAGELAVGDVALVDGEARGVHRSQLPADLKPCGMVCNTGQHRSRGEFEILVGRHIQHVHGREGGGGWQFAGMEAGGLGLVYGRDFKCNREIE